MSDCCYGRHSILSAFGPVSIQLKQAFSIQPVPHSDPELLPGPDTRHLVNMFELWVEIANTFSSPLSGRGQDHVTTYANSYPLNF